METKDQNIKGKEAFEIQKITQSPLVQRQNIISGLYKDEDGQENVSCKIMQVARSLVMKMKRELKW